MPSVQLAHKFNVKTALDHCDLYLAKRAGEDEEFLQMGTVQPFHTPYGVTYLRPKEFQQAVIASAPLYCMAKDHPFVSG